MKTTYRRNRKSSFFGHTIVIARAKTALLRLFFTALAFISLLALILNQAFLLPYLTDTDFLLACLKTTSPYLCDTQLSVSSITPKQLLHTQLPLIRSNAIMAKKYATQDPSIRLIRKPPKSENGTQSKVETIDMSANGITFSNATEYAVDVVALSSAPLSFCLTSNEPQVLIVHTHASEAYSDSAQGRSKDAEKNVIRIGKEIAEQLNKKGIKTIHDTTKNDEPDYNGSYKKALGVIEKNLRKYPSIEIVLDVHRDYTVRDSGKETEIALKPTQTEKGVSAAQIMFVVGTDALGLSHPDWQHNLAFAVQLQKTMNKLHPNLCRPINLRTERFNQHMTKGSLIIEVGSSSNTLSEAIRSGTYIAEALSALLLN